PSHPENKTTTPPLLKSSMRMCRCIFRSLSASSLSIFPNHSGRKPLSFHPTREASRYVKAPSGTTNLLPQSQSTSERLQFRWIPFLPKSHLWSRLEERVKI